MIRRIVLSLPALIAVLLMFSSARADDDSWSLSKLIPLRVTSGDEAPSDRDQLDRETARLRQQATEGPSAWDTLGRSARNLTSATKTLLWPWPALGLSWSSQPQPRRPRTLSEFVGGERQQ